MVAPNCVVAILLVEIYNHEEDISGSNSPDQNHVQVTVQGVVPESDPLPTFTTAMDA